MALNRFFLIVTLVLALSSASCATIGVADINKSPLQFIVIGDWGTPHSKGQKRVAAQMDKLARRTTVDFIVSTGDNFYYKGVKNTADPQWESNFDNIYSLPALKAVPWYVTLGNHDYKGNIHAQLAYGKSHGRWNLPQRFYSKVFSLGGHTDVRLLFLDTSPFLAAYQARPDIYHGINAENNAAQLKWLQKSLGESSARWNIVVGHHPVYSSGRHGDTVELRELLPPLFQKYQVQACFAGHDHDLEHIHPPGMTHYFISGGGSRPRKITAGKHSLFAASSLGFAFVQLDQRCMRVSFINAEGKALYQTRFSAADGGQCQ